MPVIPCKIRTKHDRIRLININISEILVYRNPVHQFVHGARKLGCYLMDYKTKCKSKSTKPKATFLITSLKPQIIRLAQGHWNCTPSH